MNTLQDNFEAKTIFPRIMFRILLLVSPHYEELLCRPINMVQIEYAPI